MKKEIFIWLLNNAMCRSQQFHSRLTHLETDDLKNTPCILVMNQARQKEEQNYYEKIIGLNGPFLFADNIQEARLKHIEDFAEILKSCF